MSAKDATAVKYAMDVFTHAIPVWERFLVPRFAGKQTRAMDIGAMEGRSTRWMMDHVLNHAKSRVTVITSFVDRPFEIDGHCEGHHERKVPPCMVTHTLKVFRRNLGARNMKKIDVMEGDTCAVLRANLSTPKLPDGNFDLVYIDPPLHARGAMEAAVLAFPLLKPGGILIFDDYTWSKEHDGRCPRQGIDAFLTAYASDLRVLYYGWQVIIERRIESIPKPPCISELHDPPKNARGSSRRNS